jgi:hypothetical protein
MKMMKALRTVALSMTLTGLSTLPVAAFSGSVDPAAITPDAVTCINYTTGLSAPGQLLNAGQFDCSGLDYEQDDRIGVVLLGNAGGGSGPGQCEKIQESPKTGFTIVGELAPNQCVTIVGKIDRPFDQNNLDTWDFFRIALDGPTTLSLLFESSAKTGFGMAVVNPKTGKFVTSCKTFDCQAAVKAGDSDIAVIGETPAQYRLTITAGAAKGSTGIPRQSRTASPALKLRLP